MHTSKPSISTSKNQSKNKKLLLNHTTLNDKDDEAGPFKVAADAKTTVNNPSHKKVPSTGSEKLGLGIRRSNTLRKDDASTL
jgi:hypothetical protein